MHTFERDYPAHGHDADRGLVPVGPVRAHFNSDLSGDVILEDHRGLGIESIRVPGEFVLAFVAEYVRREKITRLEGAGTDELLGLPPQGTT